MTEHPVHNVVIWSWCLVATAGIVARPFKLPEWIWALTAAVGIAVSGALPFSAAARSVGQGTDVYLFLAGMMLLSELARREGVFDWVAALAVRASGGSRRRLFALVYGVGILVTTVLSNDATAVVLTPAVAAAVRAAEVEPLPYLFACAFVSNAASFVLPISNPANLVVFSSGLPALPKWIAMFALPSIFSIGITYGVLLFVFHRELSGHVRRKSAARTLGVTGWIALAGIGLTAIALIVASGLDQNLGAVTLAAAAAVFLLVAALGRGAALPVLTSVSWSVLVLVASLFVLVAAAEETGLLALTQLAALQAARWSAPFALAAAAFMTGIASNLINNLPAGRIAGIAIASTSVSDAFRSAVAIGIDLGPNLSVTGSLATILWLLALRRERIDVDGWRFLRVGALAMPAALLFAVESLLLTLR